MATSNVAVTEGSGKYLATNSISEDAVTKQISRVAINNSSGTELATSSNPLQVSLANTAANSTAVKVDGSAATQPVSGTVTATLSHGKTIKNYSATITSDTDIVAAVSSKRIKVFAYSIITTDNTGDTVIFKSNGTGGTELWRVYLKGPDASTPHGANLATSVPSFLFATVAGEKLTADVSSAATLHLSISYWDDDAS